MELLLDVLLISVNSQIKTILRKAWPSVFCQLCEGDPFKQAEAAVRFTSTYTPCHVSKHLISHTCHALHFWLSPIGYALSHDISYLTLDVEVLSAKACYVYCNHWCFSQNKILSIYNLTISVNITYITECIEAILT